MHHIFNLGRRLGAWSVVLAAAAPAMALPPAACEYTLQGCGRGGVEPPAPLPRGDGRIDHQRATDLPRRGGQAVRTCRYFEHANFKGDRGYAQLGLQYGYVGRNWNDRISSVDCDPGCTLIAYEHRDFKGAVREFAGSTPFVGPDWNDRISSIRIRC